MSALYGSVDFGDVVVFAAASVTAIGLATETDSTFHVQPALRLASETDTAFTVAATKGAAIGLTTETDSSLALAPTKSKAIGLTTETDSAFGFQTGVVGFIGFATETDSTFSVTNSKSRTIGLASETSSVTSFAHGPVTNTVKPSVQNGFYYISSSTGVTGGVEPTWPTTLGATVVDNGITWTAIRAYRQNGVVASVASRRVFQAINIDDPTGEEAPWWRGGTILWLTGANAGLLREVFDDNGTGLLALREEADYPVVFGDTFEVTVGCDKSLTMCKARFDNKNNFRGEPYVPSSRTTFAINSEQSSPVPVLPDIVPIGGFDP
jgi:hypothetical protein